MLTGSFEEIMSKVDVAHSREVKAKGEQVGMLKEAVSGANQRATEAEAVASSASTAAEAARIAVAAVTQAAQQQALEA